MDRTKGAPRRRDGTARHALHTHAASTGRTSLTLRTSGERNAKAFTFTLTATRANAPKGQKYLVAASEAVGALALLLALLHSQKHPPTSPDYRLDSSLISKEIKARTRAS